MMTNAEGAREIRSAFRDLSSFVRVHLVNELRQLRRNHRAQWQLLPLSQLRQQYGLLVKD